MLFVRLKQEIRSSQSGLPALLTGKPIEQALVMVGTFVGSHGGWWLGAHVGIMTAFMLSMAGTGLGLYGGRRLARNYE